MDVIRIQVVTSFAIDVIKIQVVASFIVNTKHFTQNLESLLEQLLAIVAEKKYYNNKVIDNMSALWIVDFWGLQEAEL